MTVPSGEELLSSHMLRKVELVLQGRVVNADLIVLPLPEFDLILEMDWLTKNGVTIDLKNRTVTFRQPQGWSLFSRQSIAVNFLVLFLP